ncbi:hypothetical protein C6P44_004913 [Monosporozyma unispora]|nr:hypothetical protein C6P44_004913 [Kazachstania unispora]
MTTINNSPIDQRRRSPMNINPIISPMGMSPGSRSNPHTPMDSSPLKAYSTHINNDPMNRLRASPEPIPVTNTPSTQPPRPRVGRVRSNSRSTGSQYQTDLDQFTDLTDNANNIEETINIETTIQNIEKPEKNHKLHITAESNHSVSNDSKSSNNSSNISLNKKDHKSRDSKSKDKSVSTNTVPPSSLTSRNKYTHIIILKSLNRTFDTKFLMVPFKPEILKLGRPVVNNNSTNSGSGNGKSGGNNNTSNNENAKRNSSSLVRPDNGNFDSRVLSRNHACLTCDPKTGKIYIKDLKSSNGTFINGTRIDQNEVELKVGDVINLGTDIDTKFEHRKISAFVEEITIIPLINGLSPNEKELNTGNNTLNINNEKKIKIEPIDVSPLSAQRAAFEAAMFGDVNNLDLEDAILGPETEILSGIFINNSIGTSPQLMNVIKMLSTELSLGKQEYSKLRSMENFMINYTTNLEYINKLMIEMNDRQLIKLQETLKKSFTEKHEKVLKETKDQIVKMNDERDKVKEHYLTELKENKNTISSLEMKMEDLKTRLEVEKYKNSQLNKKLTTKVTSRPELSRTTSSESTLLSKTNSNSQNGDNKNGNSQSDTKTDQEAKNIPLKSDKTSSNETSSKEDTIVESEKKDLTKDNKTEQDDSDYRRKFRSIIFITAFSVGLFAVLLKSKFV